MSMKLQEGAQNGSGVGGDVEMQLCVFLGIILVIAYTPYYAMFLSEGKNLESRPHRLQLTFYLLKS